MRCVDISMIPIGKDHAITRRQLCIMAGKSDRNVRNDIAALRRKAVICSSSSGEGYYQPETREDIESFIAETAMRAKSIFMSLKMARTVLDAWHQPDLLEAK